MKYLHTNLVAKDWQALSAFYQQVFGCRAINQTRDYTGHWIENVVGIPGVRVVGEHLRLPGYGDDGPTLEIFSYSMPGGGGPARVNDFGFAHICFEIPRGTIAEVMDRIVAHGGTILSTFPDTEKEALVCVYTRDPEGNIVEIHY